MEEKACGLLSENRDKLDSLIEGLLEHETLDKPMIDRILAETAEIAPASDSRRGNGHPLPTK